jgi:hypothetical protein
MLEALADFVGGNGGSNCGKNRICSTPRATSRRNEISLFFSIRFPTSILKILPNRGLWAAVGEAASSETSSLFITLWPVRWKRAQHFPFGTVRAPCSRKLACHFAQFAIPESRALHADS